jgi:hypothetical protein
MHSLTQSLTKDSQRIGRLLWIKAQPTADFVTAAAELYASTGELQYRAAAENNKSSAGNPYSTFCYNNVMMWHFTVWELHSGMKKR